jgi:hypothetical protein
MKTEFAIDLDLKKQIILELIRLKGDQLHQLKLEQKERLENANMEDIDKGDPIESPKQQMMADIELHASRLDQISADIVALLRIDLTMVHSQVSYGSLIRTNRGYILVGIAFTDVFFEDKKIIGISTNSPLFQKMEGLKGHTEFHLGNIEYVIFEIV